MTEIKNQKRFPPTEIKIEEDWLWNYRVKIKTERHYKRYIVYCSWFPTIQYALEYSYNEFKK